MKKIYCNEDDKPNEEPAEHLEQQLSDGLVSFDQLLHAVADEIKSVKKQSKNDKTKDQ